MRIKINFRSPTFPFSTKEVTERKRVSNKVTFKEPDCIKTKSKSFYLCKKKMFSNIKICFWATTIYNINNIFWQHHKFSAFLIEESNLFFHLLRPLILKKWNLKKRSEIIRKNSSNDSQLKAKSKDLFAS